jgi:hypothetical protein
MRMGARFCAVVLATGFLSCSNEIGESSSDPIVGCWATPTASALTDGTIRVDADGTLAHDSNRDTGNWTSLGASNYRLTWSSGYIDSASLSRNELVVSSTQLPSGAIRSLSYTLASVSCSQYRETAGGGSMGCSGCSADSDCGRCERCERSTCRCIARLTCN